MQLDFVVVIALLLLVVFDVDEVVETFVEVVGDFVKVVEDVVEGAETVEILVMLVDVDEEDLLVTLLLPTPPFKFEIPVFCRLVGNKGWMSFTQTPWYIPGDPSLAGTLGSRLPHVPPSAQQGL